MDSGIAIFRPERIHSIFETDPGFYRTPGGDLMATINGLCACGDNGALLGYGARNWSVPPGVRVIIRDRQRLLFMFFVSHPAEASRFARERLMDIASYTGQQFYYEIRDSNA